MQERDWRTWIAWGLGALVILWVAGSLFGGWHSGGAWGMMQPEVLGKWRHGPMAGGWGFGPVSLLFGLVGLMVRLGILALLALGGLWLFYRRRAPQEVSFTSWLQDRFGAVAAPTRCAHCGQPVRGNWRHCPQCGQPLPHTDEDGTPPPTETVHV